MRTHQALVMVVAATLAVGCSNAGDRETAAAGAATAAPSTTGTPAPSVDEPESGEGDGAEVPPGVSGGAAPDGSPAPSISDARPSPWPPPLPADVPTSGADDWRPGWTPAPDAEQQYLADLDPGLFPILYTDEQSDSLLGVGYSICSAYYEGASELDVYDRLADGEWGLPGPTPFDLAEQARAVSVAAYDNLCANVRPYGPDAAPTPTAGADARTPDPVVVTGAENAVVPIRKPAGPTSAALLTITGNDAGQDFSVRAVDGEAKPLVKTTGPYSGTVVIDAGSTRTTQLEVTATGPWSIQVADPRSAPLMQAGENTGTGDRVLRYEQGVLRGVVQIDGGVEGGRFEVLAYTELGIDQLVTSTSPYSGQVRINAPSALVAVTGSGAWSIFLK